MHGWKYANITLWNQSPSLLSPDPIPILLGYQFQDASAGFEEALTYYSEPIMQLPLTHTFGINIFAAPIVTFYSYHPKPPLRETSIYLLYG